VGRLTLGKAIRSIRLSEEESQTKFAIRLNISVQYLCDLEHNRKVVSARKAKLFADILGYPPEQFIALAFQDSLEHDRIHMQVEVRAA
jgi:transcriptional regulator with XRE-family HTH domain